jgi:hypothetical protein
MNLNKRHNCHPSVYPEQLLIYAIIDPELLSICPTLISLKQTPAEEQIVSGKKLQGPD